MASYEEKIGDCNICCNKDVVLFSPKDFVSEFFNIECEHYCCKSCWTRISFNEDIVCPYCRCDVTKWLNDYLNIPIFHNNEARTISEKEKYANRLSNNNYVVRLSIIDAYDYSIETFFFSPTIKYSDVDTENMITKININNIFYPLINKRRYRKIDRHRFIINEYYDTFPIEKIKLVTDLTSRREIKCGYECIKCMCNVTFRVENYDKHIKCDRHTMIFKYYIDNMYDLFVEKFNGKNIDNID